MSDSQPAPAPEPDPERFNAREPHPARVYNYWLGGKDHFQADRNLAEAVAAAYPGVRTAAQQNRAFLRRAVAYLAAHGIDQFFDIGPGLPAPGNTHEVAQTVDPAAKVVYVDNDPLVLTHARALPTSTTPGTVGHLDADLRQPHTILHAQELTDTLDVNRPIGLLLVAVLHFLPTEDDPYSVVRHLVDAMPDSSYLVLSHATLEHQPDQVVRRLDEIKTTFQTRSRDEVARFVDGLDLVPPGLTSIVDWPTTTATRPSAEATGVYGVVARIR